jgi:hypothetical protein
VNVVSPGGGPFPDGLGAVFSIRGKINGQVRKKVGGLGQKVVEALKSGSRSAFG